MPLTSLHSTDKQDANISIRVARSHRSWRCAHPINFAGLAQHNSYYFRMVLLLLLRPATYPHHRHVRSNTACAKTIHSYVVP